MSSDVERLETLGYLHLPSVVSAERVAAVNAAIDADRALHFDPARQAEYDSRSASPDLRETPIIRDLLATTPARQVVERFLGWDAVRIDAGQIAIRPAHQVAHPEPAVPHIDGIPTADNGVRGQFLHTFTALVGVFLSQTPSPDAGNFTVWPGSHARISAWYRDRGPSSMLAPQLPPVDLGAPQQLITGPGDVVLCAYSLAHGVVANASAVERRAVFYRVNLRDLWRPDLRWRRLCDPLDGWRVRGAPTP